MAAGAIARTPEAEGLTGVEAVARRRRGEGNVAVTGTSRTQIVLPALVLWLAALSGAYRLRLLDRVLGIDRLPAERGPTPR